MRICPRREKLYIDSTQNPFTKEENNLNKLFKIINSYKMNQLSEWRQACVERIFFYIQNNSFNIQKKI